MCQVGYEKKLGEPGRQSFCIILIVLVTWVNSPDSPGNSKAGLMHLDALLIFLQSDLSVWADEEAVHLTRASEDQGVYRLLRHATATHR